MGVFQTLFQSQQQPSSSSSYNMAEPNHNILQQEVSPSSPTSQRHSMDTSRFVMHGNHQHSHHLTSPTPSKLSSSLNDIMDGWRGLLWGDNKMSPDALQEERSAVDTTLKRTPSKSYYLDQKWGNCQEIIGRGAYGKIRVIHKNETFYAVKEFRKKNSESPKRFIQRITNEYQIASSLHHKHVIQTFDLLPLNETSPIYCQVMEYCDGGDLFALIFESADGLIPAEANCFFKQLMQGVDYLHHHHIVHRDLKPENLLLSSNGCLKISDFDTALVDEHDSKNHQQAGLVGSEPYIAPEQFEPYEYDAMMADIWSCGIIYMAMRTGNQMWQVAKQGDDEDYDRYIKFRQLIDGERQKVKRERLQRRQMALENQCDREWTEKREVDMIKAREAIKKRAKEDGCDVFHGLEMGPKRLIYRMLDPNPNKRPTAKEVINSNEWMVNVVTCQPASST
ncbi:kinase-like domain-containing protein [Phascolomyces articulosus]|uniref:non-specific serine/threonine protein kinase n=1 Tax=Phascolomyces articulosus TaxID=60185 RepID=A0AAD5L0C4_9FUNG|nr:kinase-like domain-containing protein [Phascolomyces articulosus]